jgi:hypothetical protein
MDKGGCFTDWGEREREFSKEARATEADSIVREMGSNPLATAFAWGVYARCIWCREQAPFAKDIKHADGCVVARARAYVAAQDALIEEKSK